MVVPTVQAAAPPPLQAPRHGHDPRQPVGLCPLCHQGALAMGAGGAGGHLARSDCHLPVGLLLLTVGHQPVTCGGSKITIAIHHTMVAVRENKVVAALAA